MSANEVNTLIKLRTRLEGEDLKSYDDLLKKIGVDVEDLGQKAKKSWTVQDTSAKQSASSMKGYYLKVMGAAVALKKFYEEAKATHQAQVKMGAILASTGNAAGYTTRGMRQLVDSIVDYSGQSKAVVTNAAAIALTFTNISKDIFPDFMQRASDLSQTMGGDLKGATIQLGKALNDPANGYAALKDSGISFSAQQIQQIKHFSATNQVAKAQAIILDELKVELGGVADAMNTSDYGKMDRGLNAIKEGAASLVGQLSPAIGAVGTLFKWIGSLISSLNGFPLILGAAAAAVLHFTTIVKSFSMGPLGWVLTGLAGLAGILGLVGGGTAAVAQNTKELIEEYKQLKKADQLADALEKSNAGSKEQIRLQQEALKLYPQFQTETLKTAGTMIDLANAIRRANAEQKSLLRKGALENYAKIRDEINLVARLPVDDVSSRLSAEDQKEYVKKFKLLITQVAFAFEGLTDKFSTQAMNFGLDDIEGLAKRFKTGVYPIVLGMIAQARQRKFLDFDKDTGSYGKPFVPDNKGTPEKPSMYDPSGIRTELEQMQSPEVMRQLIQLYQWYADEKKKIDTQTHLEGEKGKIKAKEDLDALYDKKYLDLSDKQKKELDEKEREQRDKAHQEQKTIIDNVAGYWSSVMQAANGDIAGASLGVINRVADQTKSATLGWIGFGLTMVKDVVSIFMGSTETQLEKLEKRMAKIKEEMEFKDGVAGLSAGLFGEDSLQSIEDKLAAATTGGSGRLDALGVSGMTREQIYTLLSNMDTGDRKTLGNFYKGYSDQVGQILQKYSYGAISKDKAQAMVDAVEAQYRQQLYTFFGEAGAAEQYLKAFEYGMTTLWDPARTTKILEEMKLASENMASADTLGQQKAILKYQERMAELSHLVATGKMEETDADRERLALYDEMIESLIAYMDVAENDYEIQEAINGLEEERYALQLKMTEAKKSEYEIDQKYLQGEMGGKLRDLLEMRKKIQEEISSGRMSESQGGLALQQLDSSIIRNLKGQGAGSDVYGTYQQEIVDLSKQFLGAAYGSMTGQGYTPMMDSAWFGAGSALGAASGGSVDNSLFKSNSDNSNVNQTFYINGTASTNPEFRQIFIQMARELGLKVS